MSNNWNDEQFSKWIELRTEQRAAKKCKDFSKLIKISKEIIELSSIAKFIGIMVPLFQKDIGDAEIKLGNVDEAKKFYILSFDGLKQYREGHKLNEPSDWIKEMNLLKKKIESLSRL